MFINTCLLLLDLENKETNIQKREKSEKNASLYLTICVF